MEKISPPFFILVSIGALLIGVGGAALATIVAGRPPELVSILPAVLLDTAVFLAGGATLGRKALFLAAFLTIAFFATLSGPLAEALPVKKALVSWGPRGDV